jgi:1,2-dihydroxy-3-keto-5-methylthiopentene dioxygenase
MAVVSIPAEGRTVHDEIGIQAELAPLGVSYERWDLSRVPEDASADAVLAAYAAEIDEMKRVGGYTTADVIDVTAETPGLEVMLAKFDREHTHSEDEVRFILAGRGIFFLRQKPECESVSAKDQSTDALGDVGKVISVEVGPGDLLRVPTGTTHWFTLCEDRRIRAIRWFQDTTGWAPHYTESGIDRGFQPLCFGPAYMGGRVETAIKL